MRPSTQQIKLPESDYLHFVHVMQVGYAHRVSENEFNLSRWKHSRSTALVLRKDLLARQELGKSTTARVFCTFFSLTSNQPLEILERYHWTYKLNAGGYYLLTELWYEQDVLEYTCGRRKFDQIRTAYDLMNPK